MPRPTIGGIGGDGLRGEFADNLRATPLQPVRVGENDQRARVPGLRGNNGFVDRYDHLRFIAL
jgi:hypothetical protein